MLNQIYKQEGGVLGAYKKARKGEMIKVLTKLAEIMENIEVENFVTGVMSKVDPMDFDKHVEIARAYKDRFGSLLPKKLKTAKPEVLATNWDSLMHSHAAAMEQAKQNLEHYEPKYETDKKAA